MSSSIVDLLQELVELVDVDPRWGIPLMNSIA